MPHTYTSSTRLRRIKSSLLSLHLRLSDSRVAVSSFPFAISISWLICAMSGKGSTSISWRFQLKECPWEREAKKSLHLTRKWMIYMYHPFQAFFPTRSQRSYSLLSFATSVLTSSSHTNAYWTISQPRRWQKAPKLHSPPSSRKMVVRTVDSDLSDIVAFLVLVKEGAKVQVLVAEDFLCQGH